MEALLFWAIAAAVLVAGVLVVRLGNIFHAGLCLIVTFGGVAAIYAMLGAHFVAAVQVLIYVGAIAVILMFAVMLTQHIAQREAQVPLSRHVAAALSCGLFAFFGLVVVNAQSWDVAASPNYLEIREIGRQFLDKNHLLLPFEMVAVLLLVALVGAVMVAWKEGGE